MYPSEINNLDRLTLRKYFNITQRIEDINKEIVEKGHSIYQKNLYTGITYDEIGMYTTAPRIDCLVIGALDGIELLQQRKERLKIKQRYFRCFLSGLSTTEVNQLKQCLKATSDDLGVFERALDEIYEIETAIALRYGYEVPAERIAFEVTDNPLDNLESILLALEV